VDRRRLSLRTLRDAAINGAGGGGGAVAGRGVLRRLPDRSQTGAGSALLRPSATAPPRLMAVRRPALWVPRSAMGREALVTVPVDGAVQGVVGAALPPPPETPPAERGQPAPTP
jgi:hypothetical protein